MIRRKRRATPPGEILAEMFLKPNDITQVAFAEAIGVSRKHLSEIIHDKQRLEPEVAAKIARALGTSTEFWLNLQRTVDVWDAEEKIKRWKPARTFDIQHHLSM